MDVSKGDLSLEGESVAGGGDVSHVFAIPEDGLPTPGPGIGIGVVLHGIKEEHDEHPVNALLHLLNQGVTADEVNVGLADFDATKLKSK